MTEKKDDNFLIKSLISGNETGILQIYKKMYPSVLSYIVKHDGTEHDAKEIFQKALLQLVVRTRVKGFQVKTSFEGYFFTVCKNLWIKEIKSLKDRVTNEGNPYLINEEREIALCALEQEKWELFQEKLSGLSENCRKVLKCVFTKTPYIQIANKFGYNSENVVRQRVHKCKAQLREAIHKDVRYLEIKQL